ARCIIDALRTRGITPVLSSSSGKAGSITLDLGKPESIHAFFLELEKKFPEGDVEVFLPGALTHVDKCEVERELCGKINRDGPILVATECAKRGYGLTFFSTEYVFGNAEYEGGAVGPFTETDTPAPTSWYGQCKLAAEQGILQVLPGALIVRTTMVFCWDQSGMNFLMQYIRHLEAIREGRANVFKIPEDQISTPTYAQSLGEGCLLLREKRVGGIINIVGSDFVSRKDLVEQVIAEFGFDREQSLRGFQFLKTKDLGQTARRPLTAGLTCEKARSLGVKIYSLAEAFAEAKAKRQAQGVR
ncbi:MAG: SDR family oxidoreductase, partial [Bdellovibrionota bacterium]